MGWLETFRQRGALMYTVGVWTVFGSVVYYASGYVTKREEPPEMPEDNATRSTISEDGLKETTVYRKPGSSYYVVSTTRYKPDFVPYTTRLYNYIQSFLDNSDSKGK